MLNRELSHDLVRPGRGMRRPVGTQGNGHPMMARLNLQKTSSFIGVASLWLNVFIHRRYLPP